MRHHFGCRGQLCGVLFLITGLTATGLASKSAGASATEPQYLVNTRFDPSVPANCRQFEIQDFSETSRIVLVGLEGSRKGRFTHEFPLGRQEANLLWIALSPETAGSPQVMEEIRANPRLRELHALLQQLGAQMGIDYGKEGDVLEALALYMLREVFPESQYFLTGGVEYGDFPRTSVIGELDIIVARRSDCKVVAIGESKLGIRQGTHARAQLSRFLGFARQKLCRGTEQRRPVCKLQ
ncbi:MAG: hypothetical protein NDJ89_04565 [Oligoflexia bacterium]|nr:hypothetical protein [Oligoflexia bacterium]